MEDTNEKLKQIYYQPQNLWRGSTAIKKLQYISGEDKHTVTEWLARQALWQVHIPPPSKIDHPHYYITEVNKIHQADLLYLPHDRLYQNTYKYVLNVIDAASRFKASRPLRSKKPKELALALKDIYKMKGGLSYPNQFHCDNGSEFKGDVDNLLKDHNVKIKRVTTKYHHKFTAFVERFNKTLAEKLFKVQDAQELNDPTKDSKTWVKHLQTIVRKLNNTKTEMIDMKPVDAIKLKEVKLNIKPYPKETPLPADGLYRYLYEPGELEGGQKRRATDMIWSWNTFRLDRIIQNPGQRTLYYLSGDAAPKRAFVEEELMQIPEDTHSPPDWVKSW